MNPGRGASLNDRVHFMAVASRAMRAVLVDHARSKLARKRGGGAEIVSLEEHHAVDERTIERDWFKARSFLHRQLGGEP